LKDGRFPPDNSKRALRLARYFGTSAEFWIGMQATYDLEMARDQVNANIKVHGPG
jgi:plasmid maintenance system antidote protein VapI